MYVQKPYPLFTSGARVLITNLLSIVLPPQPHLPFIRTATDKGTVEWSGAPLFIMLASSHGRQPRMDCGVSAVDERKQARRAARPTRDSESDRLGQLGVG